MTGDGVFLEPLGLYLVLERQDGRIRRTRFSRYPSDRPLPQDLSDRIRKLLKNPAREEEEYGLPKDILDLSMLTKFQREVLDVVAFIPWGETMTYGQVAERLGRHGAARAVGRALAANPFPLIIPCHRVVAVNGIGGYGPGTNLKKMLMDLEANRVDDASSGV